jgi:hypothetical protein
MILHSTPIQTDGHGSCSPRSILFPTNHLAKLLTHPIPGPVTPAAPSHGDTPPRAQSPAKSSPQGGRMLPGGSITWRHDNERTRAVFTQVGGICRGDIGGLVSMVWLFLASLTLSSLKGEESSPPRVTRSTLRARCLTAIQGRQPSPGCIGVCEKLGRQAIPWGCPPGSIVCLFVCSSLKNNG